MQPNLIVMEFLYVVLLLIIIYLQMTTKSSLAEKTDALENKILELQRLLKQSLQTKSTVESPKPEVKPIPKPVAEPEIRKPEEPKSEAPLIPKPAVAETVEWHKEAITDPLAAIRRPVKTDKPHVPAYAINDEPELSFFDRHPDLEKFIGENLINKIGIAILVLAIGFFVKYAIDNNWIGPVGRVGIGVLCGGILIGIAHKMRNSYKAFSSVLVGGGLAVLYFTITLAYHQFHLFNQTTSFIILIVITCFAVALALLYDKQELAVIALIGGLSSPFMVSGDTANYHALFTYLVILNTGLLVIAYRKEWRILNISTFGLTVIVFGASAYTLTRTTYSTGFIYATILYLLFFAINVANNVRENKKFLAADFSILLINTALYFGLGLCLLTQMGLGQYRGLFSASLGFINLVLSFVLFKNKKVDTNVLYLLIGITLTFISLTAPIQLHGNNITLFWAAETVLLYWLYQKSQVKLMKLTSLLVWIAMLVSLLIDWMQVYQYQETLVAIMANRGFITTIFAALSSYLLFIQSDRDESKEIYNIEMVPGVYKYVSFGLLFISGVLEINHQFLNRYPDTTLNSLYLMLYVPAFVYVFYMLSKRITGIQLNWIVGAVLMVLSIAFYLAFTPQYFDAEYTVLILHKASAMHFAAHWLGAILIGLLFYQLIRIAKEHLPDEPQKTASWILSSAIVLFLSLELCLVSSLLFYRGGASLDSIETVYVKVGLPILWGLASFALMWLGMRHKARTLRVISLTLFSVTLIKLFAFDIQNIPPAGKIAAFFCLGVLLLIVSFMYQKVKKIIVEDEQPHQD